MYIVLERNVKSSSFIERQPTTTISGGGGGGGVALLINGLMGMCRWMGSHFHNWICHNGVAFSTDFSTELLEWGRKLLGF